MTEQSKWAIACERCGVVEASTTHLAVHLVAHHGLPRNEAIQEAKETRARLNAAPEERIRKAAPLLLSLLIQAQEDVCSLRCPSEWRTGQPQPHSDLCKEINAVVKEARGE